ncbi:MAG: CoA transferase, partial [Hyphomicrobiaceae bacterium]
GHEDNDARNAPHDMIFDTADGHLTVGAISDAEWRALCNALGHPEWIEDPRFLTGAQRSKNRQERLELVQGVLKTDATETWLVRFAEHDVPSAPVLKRAAAIEHAQIRANDLIVEIDQPGVGPVRQARPAARFETTPAAIGGVAPHLGADSVQVLAELGYDEDDIERLLASGATAAAQE